jgi:hypothetical protein
MDGSRTFMNFDPLHPPRWALRDPEGRRVDIGTGESFARFCRHFLDRGYTLELLGETPVTVTTVEESWPE